MTISVGERYVRYQAAARSAADNDVDATISYDTAHILEGGYTYNGPDVEVDTAGLYLWVGDLGKVNIELQVWGNGTLWPRINGTTDLIQYRGTHRVTRGTTGTHWATSIGAAILDLAADDTVEVRIGTSATGTSAYLDYATDANLGGGLQLVRLPDGNLTEVSRSSDLTSTAISLLNTTRPWTESDGDWEAITFDSEDRDDDGLYPGTGSDLTLKADTKYLIMYGAFGGYDTSDTGSATLVTRLRIDGVTRQGGSGMNEDDTNCYGAPIVGAYLHETGGSTETLRLEHTFEAQVDPGDMEVKGAYLQVLELPDSAEWIHADNSTTDSLESAWELEGTWDTIPLQYTFRADGDSDLSLDTTNDAIQNDSGSTMPVLAIGWIRGDYDAINTSRMNSLVRWDNDGSPLAYGVSGAFARGGRPGGNTWQFHSTGLATLDLANGADLSLETDSSDTGVNPVGVFASTNRHWLGVQVLKLDSLSDGGTTYQGAIAEGLKAGG